MAGYQRFVSYMYEYTKGKKSKNTGFAKVESRNGVCRMQVNLQGIPAEEGVLNIYGFVRRNDQLLGIFLGQIPIQGERADARITTPTDQIGGQSFSLDDLAGIWTQTGFHRNYITVFDDEEVDVNKFVTEIPGESEPQLSAENEMQEEAVVSEAEPEPESVEPEAEPEPEPESVELAAEPEAEPEPEPVESVAELESEPEIEAAEFQMTLERPVAEEALPEHQAAQEPVTQIPNVKSEQPKQQTSDQRWSNMTKRYPRFQPFPEPEFADCIQILPRDLRMLSQNNWRLGNNSFVMHGYYNYRHLLFAKKKDGGYVLGVPGIYENQEKYMADMFGFTDFKDTGRQNKSRPFGYWCREIE